MQSDDFYSLYLEHSAAGKHALSNRDYTNAEKHCKAAIEFAEKYGEKRPALVGGRENIFLIVALGDLASVYFDTNRDAEIEPLYKRRVEIAERIKAKFPEKIDLDYLAHIYNDLAMFYLRQGKLEEAKPSYQRTLAILESLHGPSSPKLADKLEVYASVLRLKNHKDEADKLEARLQAIKR